MYPQVGDVLRDADHAGGGEGLAARRRAVGGPGPGDAGHGRALDHGRGRNKHLPASNKDVNLLEVLGDLENLTLPWSCCVFRPHNNNFAIRIPFSHLDFSSFQYFPYK